MRFGVSRSRRTLGLLIEAEHHRPGRRLRYRPTTSTISPRPRIVADLECLDLPRLEVVIGPDLGHRIFADPHPRCHRSRRPVRRPIGRTLFGGQPKHFFKSSRWQAGLAATPLGDPADTLRCPPRRIGNASAAALSTRWRRVFHSPGLIHRVGSNRVDCRRRRVLFRT